MQHTILVIDDELQLLDSIQELLELEGYRVYTASNGQEGLLQAIERTPDLILCDIRMPKLDGYQTLKAIRETSSIRHVPFLFLTAKTEHKDYRKAMSLGADDYLTKPFTAEELFEAVRVRLVRREALKEDFRQKLNRVQAQISRTTMHELNTPMNGILGGLDLLIQAWDSFERQEVFEMLQAIKVSSERLHRTLTNQLFYHVLQQVQQDAEHRASFCVGQCEQPHELVGQVFEQAAQIYGRPGDLFLELTPLLDLAMARPNVQKVLEEIADNAFKFSQPGDEVRVNSHYTDRHLVLTIQDQGRGMTPAQVQQIAPYRQFERQRYEQQGSGLGLYLVKTLLTYHQGALQLRPRSPRGLEVALQFPVLSPASPQPAKHLRQATHS